MRRAASLIVTVLVAMLIARPSYAQRHPPPEVRVYVVIPGDTLLRVANRLGVPPRELAARNYLPRPYTLSVGQRLRVPAGVRPEVLNTLPTRDEATNSGSPQGAHRAGIVTLVRARDGQEISTNFAVGGQGLRARVERFLRARDNRQHMVHPRMMRTLQLFSDRFGGRRIEVLSGYRPARSGTPISRHSLGQAVDLRVEGAALRDVWTFCQSLHDMGCGLYVRANYVHVDVRTTPEAWQGPPRRGAHAGSTLDPDPDEDPTVVTAEAEGASR